MAPAHTNNYSPAQPSLGWLRNAVPDWKALPALAVCLSLAVATLGFGADQGRPAAPPPTALSSNPVRLAVIGEAPGWETAADLLITELSHQPGLTLLDRAEIERVLREQQLSAASNDYLKLGQVLGAQGLVLLGGLGEGKNTCIQTRLVATGPGIILGSTRAPWPAADPSDWAKRVAEQSLAFFPKLSVATTNAVPLSVLNLRSALRSPEAQALDRDLTLLLIHRLTREPELFVLERRHLREVLFEQELKPDEESAFWTGRYLLDGIVDKNGYEPGRVTISARLVPPGGGAAIPLEANGSRTNPGPVVEALAAQVLAALKRPSSASDWRPEAEAQQFLEEARWAYNWRLFAEAQAAGESAWALGSRSRATALFRIRLYSECYVPDNFADGLPPAVRSLNLFCEDPSLRTTNGAAPEPGWYDLGLKALNRAAGLLDRFYVVAELRPGNEAGLARLRAAIRDTAALLDTNRAPNIFINQPLELDAIQWAQGGLWHEKPEEALPRFHKMLASGQRPAQLPRLAAWSWEERKRLPTVMGQFLNQCRSSTNPAVRLEGLYLTLSWTPFDHAGPFQSLERELLAAMWEDREAFWTDPGTADLLDRTEKVILAKEGYYTKRHLDDAAFLALRRNLRRAYLETGPLNFAFPALFPQDVACYSAAEASESAGLLHAFRQRLANVDTRTVDGLAGFLVRSFPEAAQAVAPSAKAPPSEPAETGRVITAEFKPWGLEVKDADSDEDAILTWALVRAGKVWGQIRYGRAGGSDGETCYVGVDPRTGNCQKIGFPPQLGKPDLELFEVTEEALFVSLGNQLARYQFQTKTWDLIPIPITGGAQILGLGGRLFLASAEALIELDLKSGQNTVLASSRRRPAENPLDSAWKPGVRPYRLFRSGIFGGENGSLGVLATTNIFVLKPGETEPKAWASLTLLGYLREALLGTSAPGDNMIVFKSWDGAQENLAAFRPANSEPVCLLRHVVPGGNGNPQTHSTLGPPCWDWPAAYPFAECRFTVGGQALWVLVPRGYWRSRGEPAKFGDDRGATVLKYEPGSPRAWRVPIRFEKDGRAVNPFTMEWQSPGFSLQYDSSPDRFYWLSTPKGLVFACPKAGGYWFLNEAALAGARQPVGDPEPRAGQTRAAGTNPPGHGQP